MIDMREDIFKGLNTAQDKAVREIAGPCLIVAGAGSGKTKVLTCRIANILTTGCLPSRILALTFTKKAANEMKERIASLVGAEKARWLWMGTFHSIFIRFLRGNAALLGYPEQFTIYDQSDSRSAIRQCIKELELDEKTYTPNSVQSRISNAKNNLITPKAYRADQEIMQQDMKSKRGRICDIYDLYAKKCKTAGAMDFDDILLNTNILFKNHPDALNQIRDRFSYILVDEYQDTNYAQYLILKKLAEVHKNICVVGDDSQSIYAFRGARVENILKFAQDYPGALQVRLEQNYRSTQTIVNAANSVIEKNHNRLKKKCFSAAEEGEKVVIIKAYSEQDEAFRIATSIKDRILCERAEYASFAILYRTNAQSRALEEALRKSNIPYKVLAGHAFFDRAEVKDTISYFKLVVNPHDDQAFLRVVNLPARGIGPTTLTRLIEAANARSISLYEAVSLPNEDLFLTGLKEAPITKLRAFASIIGELHLKSTTTDAYDLAKEVGNVTGYLTALRSDTSVEGGSRLENVEELFNSVQHFIESEKSLDETIELLTLSEYLENIALLSDAEKGDDEKKEDDNKVKLMTVHSSKGLEYPYVYIAGMEEGLFPSEGNGGKVEDIEEERRLCYVAMTRAKKCITMSYATTRMRWGSHISNNPSRFLKEIDPSFLDSPIEDGMWSAAMFEQRTASNPYSRPSERPIPRPTPSVAAPHTPSENFTPSAIGELAVGQRVEHFRFGFGTIISLEGNNSEKKAIVSFNKGGNKTLLLKFAKLRIIR